LYSYYSKPEEIHPCTCITLNQKRYTLVLVLLLNHKRYTIVLVLLLNHKRYTLVLVLL